MNNNPMSGLATGKPNLNPLQQALMKKKSDTSVKPPKLKPSKKKGY